MPRAKTKKSSKRSAPKIKTPNLRKREGFIREELGELLKWDQSVIDAYIENGQIRRAFDTTKADKHLRDWKYYKCKSDNERLSALKHDEPLSQFIDYSIEENFIPCPRYLYLPMPPPITIPDPAKLRGTINYMTVFQNMPLELFSGTWVMLSHFHHFDGDTLIPAEEDFTNFPLVKLPFELLEFPLEEIERLKQNKNPRNDKGTPYDVKKREQRMRIVQKKCNFDPMKHLAASHLQKTKTKRKMLVLYFELFASEVQAYEQRKHLPKRSWAEIRDELEKEQRNGFNNTWQKMLDGKI